MNVVIRMPARGAAASVNFLNSFCRKLLAKKGSSWRTIRSGGKRLSHAPISGGRGFAMASRFAAAALLALAATTMLSTSDANAQTSGLNTLVVEITGSDVDRLDPVFSRAVTTYNVVFSEADVADSTRLSFLTSGTDVYALLCKDVSTRVGGATGGDLTLVNQELPGMNASTVLRFYAITTANVAASGVDTNPAATPPIVNPRDASACTNVEAAIDEPYVTKYTVTVTRGDPNALNSITFTPTAGATDTTTIDYVEGQTEYSAGVAAGTTAGTLSVTAAETTARFRLCNGTNEVGGGTVSTSNAITVPLDGITTTNVVTRRLIVSDDGDLVVACNANAADIQDGQDRVYTFRLVANTATGAAATATFEGMGTPSDPVFLMNDTTSSFTIDITGYTSARRNAEAIELAASIAVAAPGNVSGTIMQAVGTTLGTSDSQEIFNANYTISLATNTSANRPYFAAGSVATRDFRVIMPHALFNAGIGNNPAEGSERITINLAPRDVVDDTEYAATTFTLVNSLSGLNAAGNIRGGISDTSGDRGAATFQVFGDQTMHRLDRIVIDPPTDGPDFTVQTFDRNDAGVTNFAVPVLTVAPTTGMGSFEFPVFIPDNVPVLLTLDTDDNSDYTAVSGMSAATPTTAAVSLTVDSADRLPGTAGVREDIMVSGFTEGDNTITIVVSAEPEIPTANRTYTITATNPQDDIISAELSGLTVEVGGVDGVGGTDVPLSPTFAETDVGARPSTTFRATIGHADTSVTVVAPTVGGGIISISGTNGEGGELGDVITRTTGVVSNLTAGTNTITVTVRPRDSVAGDAEKTYTIVLTVPVGPPSQVRITPVTPLNPYAGSDALERTISEDGGSVTFTVELNHPVRSDDISEASPTVDIPYTVMTTGATIAADSDNPRDTEDVICTIGGVVCGVTGESIRFALGERRKTIVITGVADVHNEAAESIKIDLGTVDGASTFTHLNGTDTITLEANDEVTVVLTNEDEIPMAFESITVSADTVREDEGEAIITVSLDNAAVTGISGTNFTGDITVDLTFAPVRDDDAVGPATLGVGGEDADYTVECTPACTPSGGPSGGGVVTLTYEPGQRTKTIRITGVDDSEAIPDDEGPEAFTATLSSGAAAEGGTVNPPSPALVTVTITELTTDAVVVKNEIETVTTLIGAEQVGTISGLIRARITSPVTTPVTRAPSSSDTSSALHLPENPQNLGDMLNGLGLEHSAEADGGGVYAVWARGTYTSMEGDPTVNGMKVDYDGDSTGLGIGAEKVTSKYVAGVAINWLTTDLDLKTEENVGLSNYEESLVMIAPYLALRRGNGRSFWISAGYGFGEADGTTAEDSLTASADVNVSFLNAGADFVITMNEYGELVGTLSVLGVRKTVDAFAFEGVDPISQTSLTTFRGQGEVTYYRNIGAAGGRVRPYIGLATLHDAGDKLNDDSHALDLRGGGEFRGEKINASLEVSTELLRKDHKSWTISGSARYLFSPDELGMSLTLDGAHATDSNMGVEGGYGMMVREVHKDALLTPFAGLKHGSGGNGEVSSGMRLAIGSSMDADLRAARAFGNDEDTLKLNLRQAF